MLKLVIKWINANFWAFEITTLAIVAFFLAKGAGELLVSQLLSRFPVNDPGSFSAPVSAFRTRRHREGFEKKNGEPILRRNLFDSLTGPIDRQAEGEPPVEEETLGDMTPVPCALSDVRLLATVVSDESTDWSFASLSEGGKKTFCRVGDEVKAHEVAWITWRYLFLEGPRDICYIDIFGEENLAQQPQHRSPHPTRPATANELKKHIKVVGPNERVVKRQLVNQIMANPAEFTKKVRFRPKRINGRTTGYQLRRMKSDNPLALLGLKRRDVIRKINGIELTSTTKVLEAYQGLKSADELRFYVSRKGKPLELKIRIQ